MISKGASWFSSCFQSVSREFQENFQGVSKKFHVAWHSLQLPEQKEGSSPSSINPVPTLLCVCCTGDSLPFLDTSCSIKDRKIIVDLYRKPTDRNQYLLPSSCHPAHITNNIPFSLAYRIVRICSEPDTRDQRLDELRQLLLDRNYKNNIINSAIKERN